MLPETRQKAERAVELYRAGLKQREVGAALGVSEARVCQLLAEARVAARPRGPVPGETTKTQRDTVAAMWPRRLAGEVTTQDIANAIDRDVSTVTRIAKDLGFEVPLGRQPTYPRQEPRPCKCGCGNMVAPPPALAVAGLGGYVNEVHFEQARTAARAELAAQKTWMTVAQAAELLKLTEQACREYWQQGRLIFTMLDDIPELRHLDMLETKWLVRRADVMRLRKELLARYGTGVGPPERLVRVYGEKAQRRWDGKLAKAKAEASGKRLGPKTGPRASRLEPDDPVEATILSRFRAGQSQQGIADALGDDITRKVVRGVLRRHGLAA